MIVADREWTGGTVCGTDKQKYPTVSALKNSGQSVKCEITTDSGQVVA